MTGLARGLAVLRCFTPQRTELGTTEIARLTGLPQPTVWRLCHTLVELGYLVTVPEREKVRIGAPVLALGYAALANLDYVQVARPQMQALADRFSAAVAIAERHRLSMVYLERCQGNSVLLFNLQPGSRLPIYNTAIGWAYLAAIDDEQRDALFDEMKAVAGKDWKAEKAQIEQALEFHADHGFVLNNGVQHPGIIAVAVPVHTPGRGVLAMNLATWNSGGAEQTMVNEAGPALRHLAELLEAQEPKGDRPG
ncbi:MAG TPA: IclR family transcriptional regulator [Pseudomonadales bacterium]